MTRDLRPLFQLLELILLKPYRGAAHIKAHIFQYILIDDNSVLMCIIEHCVTKSAKWKCCAAFLDFIIFSGARPLCVTGQAIQYSLPVCVRKYTEMHKFNWKDARDQLHANVHCLRIDQVTACRNEFRGSLRPRQIITTSGHFVAINALADAIGTSELFVTLVQEFIERKYSKFIKTARRMIGNSLALEFAELSMSTSTERNNKISSNDSNGTLIVYVNVLQCNADITKSCWFIPRKLILMHIAECNGVTNEVDFSRVECLTIMTHDSPTICMRQFPELKYVTSTRFPSFRNCNSTRKLCIRVRHFDWFEHMLPGQGGLRAQSYEIPHCCNALDIAIDNTDHTIEKVYYDILSNKTRNIQMLAIRSKNDAFWVKYLKSVILYSTHSSSGIWSIFEAIDISSYAANCDSRALSEIDDYNALKVRPRLLYYKSIP
jgi:hypothetical protein